MEQLALEEAMAIAVLKGDTVAAMALADLLIDTRADPRTRGERAAKLMAERRPSRTVNGFEVYHWPEFRAFAGRLGILYDLLTTRLTITLDPDEPVTVTQEYRGVGATNAAPSAGGGG